MNHKQTPIIATLVLLLFVCAVSAVATNAATDVTNCSATLNGATDIAGNYAFEYSCSASGYTMCTENISCGAGVGYSYSVAGIPLSSGDTIYFRAVNKETGAVGAQQSFTLGAVAVLPTTTYTEEYYEPFIATKWNMAALAEVVPTAYTDKWGMFIWALFWGGLMLAFWIRQEDVTIPAFLYIIIFIALTLSDWIPVEMIEVSYLMLIVSFGGIIVSWFHGRKNG